MEEKEMLTTSQMIPGSIEGMDHSPETKSYGLLSNSRLIRYRGLSHCACRGQYGTSLYVYAMGDGGITNNHLLLFSKAPDPAPWAMVDLSASATAAAVGGNQIMDGPRAVVNSTGIHIYTLGSNFCLLEVSKAPDPAPWQWFDVSAAVGNQRAWNIGTALAIGTDVRVYAQGPHIGYHLLEFSKAPDPAKWQVMDITSDTGGGCWIMGTPGAVLDGPVVRAYVPLFHPIAPSQLEISSDPHQMVLHWSTSFAAEGISFIVERATGAAGTFAQLATVASAPFVSPTYTDASVSPSTIYLYRVKLSTPAGDSGYSNVVQATTP